MVSPREFPAGIRGLLTEAEADSCGVCIREKRAEAFELAEAWFAPGTLVRPDGARGFAVLPGGEMELYFADPDRATPRLSFRFHTVHDHLVGIDPADFTDSLLAAEVLARPEGTEGTEMLEVVAFAYGDGPAFLFDETSNRIQVQCRILGPGEVPDPRAWGGVMREAGLPEPGP